MRAFLASAGRVQTAFVARGLGVERAAVYTVLTQLHEAGEVTRRPDGRGRVWWQPRTTAPITRKERIVCALEHAHGGWLPTSQLCLAWGERDLRRGYEVLRYYRDLGLLETVSEGVGVEAVWRIRRS